MIVLFIDIVQWCWLHWIQDGKWATQKVIDVPGKKVDGWALPAMPGMCVCEEEWI